MRGPPFRGNPRPQAYRRLGPKPREIDARMGKWVETPGFFVVFPAESRFSADYAVDNGPQPFYPPSLQCFSPLQPQLFVEEIDGREQDSQAAQQVGGGPGTGRQDRIDEEAGGRSLRRPGGADQAPTRQEGPRHLHSAGPAQAAPE